MVLEAKKTPEQKRVDAYVSLLVAEVEFLKANGWVPLTPATPGGPVRWRGPHDRDEFTQSQDRAVETQKRVERA